MPASSTTARQAAIAAPLPMHLRLLGLSAQDVRFGDQIGGKQTQRVMKFFGSHTLKPSFSKYSFSPTRVR